MNGVSAGEQPVIPPERPMPAREAVVVGPVALYFEGSATAVMMVMIGAVFGVATLVLSSDQRLALVVAAVAFLLAGIALTVRLWCLTRSSGSSPAPPA